MYTKRSKKGFTITELIIVIVVIAILAAVLIPTFISLINKANLSADHQSVRQMNTILAAEEATEDIDDVGDAATILLANGIDPHHNPLTVDTAFYWVKAVNRVVHADAEKNILYPKNLGDEAEYAEGNWFSLFTGDFVGGSGTEADPYLVATEDQLQNLEDFTGRTTHIELVDDIVYTGNYIDTYFQGTLDGNGHTLYNTSTDQSGPCIFFGTYYGDTVVKNLTIEYSGLVKPLFYRNYAGYNCDGKALTIENVTVKGADQNKIYETCGYGSGPFMLGNSGAVYFKNVVNELNYTITGQGYAGIFIGNYGFEETFASFENCVNKGTVNGAYVGFFTGNETKDMMLVNTNDTPVFDSAKQTYYVSNCSNEGVIIGSSAVGAFGCNWTDRLTTHDECDEALTESQFKRGTMMASDINIGLTGRDGNAITVVGSDDENIAKYKVSFFVSVGFVDGNSTVSFDEVLTPAEVASGKTIANVIGAVTKEEYIANGGTYDVSKELTSGVHKFIVVNNDDGTRTLVINMDEWPKFRQFGEIHHSISAYNSNGQRIAYNAYYD